VAHTSLGVRFFIRASLSSPTNGQLEDRPRIHCSMSERSDSHHEARSRSLKRSGRFVLRHSLLLLALAIGCISLALVKSVTWIVPTSDEVPIVGGIVILATADNLREPPLFTYFSAYMNGGLSVHLKTGISATSGYVLLTDLDSVPCEAIRGLTITSGPTYLFDDTSLYSINQGYSRKLYSIGFVALPNSDATLTCTTAIVPQADSFVTRRIAFEPPLQKDLLSRLSGAPVKSEWVSIERLAGSSGVTFSGGERVHSSALGAILEAQEINPQDPIVRAYWTDEERIGARDFILFLAAALIGLATAGLFEWLRGLLPRGVIGRG
jgi:hypothetical protein